MADAPPPPWILRCAWCAFHITVYARGARGRDQGSGVEAANTMQDHITQRHEGKTWQDYLAEDPA